jgi:hypothetical protein
MKYLAALAAVVVALFGTGSPAAADAGWQRIPCFSGAIERAEVTGGDYLTLTGYLDCGRPADNPLPRWGYAVFLESLPNGSLNAADMRWYSDGDRTTFSDRMKVTRLPEAIGICVVTDHDVRIACVKVTRKSATSPIMAGPTSVDDVLVDRPFQLRSAGDPNPVCGHC